MRRRENQTAVLPSIIPWLLARVRLSVAYSLASTVVGEIVAGTMGIGCLVSHAAGVLDTAWKA